METVQIVKITAVAIVFIVLILSLNTNLFDKKK